jgi:uncharacterized membrane protein (DUF373 family)
VSQPESRPPLHLGTGRAARIRAHLHIERPHLGILGLAEDIIHYIVALVLMAVAVIVLYHTAHDLATTKQAFAPAATSAVNGVLFAIIVLEVMRTVVAHFETGGLQLQPFLIIGIISAVREILTVGARLSLTGTGSKSPSTEVIHTGLLELGVNAAVVLGLAGALVLIRRFAGMREDDAVFPRG